MKIKPLLIILIAIFSFQGRSLAQESSFISTDEVYANVIASFANENIAIKEKIKQRYFQDLAAVALTCSGKSLQLGLTAFYTFMAVSDSMVALSSSELEVVPGKLKENFVKISRAIRSGKVNVEESIFQKDVLRMSAQEVIQLIQSGWNMNISSCNKGHAMIISADDIRVRIYDRYPDSLNVKWDYAYPILSVTLENYQNDVVHKVLETIANWDS